MSVYSQTREQFSSFIEALRRETEVIAPVKRDAVRFEPIENAAEIHFTENSIFPLKEYFFKAREPLFLYVGKRVEEPPLRTRKRVFFGVRRCDLNAIRKQDQVYLHDLHDPYYAANRSGSVLIGYHCEKPPSRYCFCGSMDLKDFFDLMYYERGDHFLIEVGSAEGERLISKHPQHFSRSDYQLTQTERAVQGANRLKHTDIKAYYNHPLWKPAVDMCVACGQCTTLCPTCYCFEIHDEPSVEDVKSGTRVRQWSSCMLQDFTKVAGGHVFRQAHDQRFKHRIYHQLDYYKDRHGEALCTGCARCITGCPALIDFVNFINHMDHA